MAMKAGGLVKLTEECGELTQVAAKLIAYPDGPHPDGKGDLKARLEDEIADVLAATAFVQWFYSLDMKRIEARSRVKFEKFTAWSRES